MEEVLYFRIDDDKIIELFGRQNFADKKIAVYELVKNSYDAGSTIVDIHFIDDKIVISDNGCGMDKDVVRNNWMQVGYSDKSTKYSFKDVEGKERVFSGSKGVGRFALARLGETVIVNSKTASNSPIQWNTDWRRNVLKDFPQFDKKGTEIIIEHLREEWKESDIVSLYNLLCRSINFTGIDITIYYNDKKISVSNFLTTIEDTNNFLTKFEIAYDCNSFDFSFSLKSDEFDEKAQKMVIESLENDTQKKYCNSFEINSITDLQYETNIFEKKVLDNDFLDLGEEKQKDILHKIGGFRAVFYFNNFPNGEDIEKYLYKSQTNKIGRDRKIYSNTGVMLYRNSFAISNYNSKDDWLELAIRVRKSPAAPSHPDGKWRVRDNQICGGVYIDKILNENIQELQNRQGIDNNVFYITFIKIINYGISLFESYRQGIIRIVNTKNKYEEEDLSFDYKKIEDYLSNKQNNSDEFNSFAESAKKVFGDYKKKQKRLKEEVEKFDYSSRLLNVLSTQGLISFANAHELENERSNLIGFHDRLRKALHEQGAWQLIDKSLKEAIPSRNVPYLINKNEDITSKLINYIDSSMRSIQKKNFNVDFFDIKEFVMLICDEWKQKYSWISFTVNMDNFDFKISRDYIETILNNLILNSVQQNNKKKSLNIFIDCFVDSESLLHFMYKDDGKGLVGTKYLNNPRMILEPHETTREKDGGHGLGMWIVNATINNSKGNVVEITGNDGFYFEYTLGRTK